MKEGPLITSVAALLGDPARANMLTALMDGRALTVSELAEAAGVAISTASGHLSKLLAGGLLKVEKQGRHRYFRLSDPDVAQVLESLMGLAERVGAVRVRTGPKDAALRTARVCYDHLAGARGVALMQGLVRAGWIDGDDDPRVTTTGRRRLAEIGIDIETLERGRRKLCRRCLDWSERHSHLAGALGGAILDLILQEGWARPPADRVLTFTAAGERKFAQAFDLEG